MPTASGEHAGHAEAVPPVETVVAAAPGQPAATLAPGPVDAPAATAVAEAARAAALAGEMAGGHGHATGTYRQRDAGRPPGPEAKPAEEPAVEHDHPDDGRHDG